MQNMTEQSDHITNASHNLSKWEEKKGADQKSLWKWVESIKLKAKEVECKYYIVNRPSPWELGLAILILPYIYTGIGQLFKWMAGDRSQISHCGSEFTDEQGKRLEWSMWYWIRVKNTSMNSGLASYRYRWLHTGIFADMYITQVIMHPCISLLCQLRPRGNAIPSGNEHI